MRTYRMGEGLFVSASPHARDIPLLQALGITTVYTLSKKEPDPDVALHFRCVHRPIKDAKVADLEKVAYVADEVYLDLEAGRTVLVHCLAGRNRSMAVAAVAEGLRSGWSGEYAVNRVMKLRPSSFHNPAFAEAVRRLLP